MDEYTGLHVAVGIDVTVLFASCHAAVYELAVVLEVNGKEFFAAFHVADLTDLVEHVLSLFRTQQELGGCVHSHRHVVEVPCKDTSFFYKHIQELV